MPRNLDNVSRIVCDTPADDPAIMESECSVMIGGEWRDLGRPIHGVRVSGDKDSKLQDIRYVDMQTRNGELRTEIDLNPPNECEIQEDYDRGTVLSCWED